MTTAIEFFKPGKHVDVNGKTVNITADHLRATAAAYNPALHEAPLVVGHPKTDDPAYGWAQSVNFNETTQRLEAIPHQVNVQFAEMVNDGHYKKVSGSFYLPDSPGNPVPGVFYPKHIGFLGATPPAVKGLKSVEFSENEQGIVEFADWDQLTIVGLLRRFRDYLIGKEGMEVADTVLPTYEIDSLQINAIQDDKLHFSEPSITQGDSMTPAEIERMKKLEADNAAQANQITALQTQIASFAEAKTKALHAEHVSFAEGLVKAGRLLPAKQGEAVAMLNKLAADESTVEFGEGDDKQSLSPLGIYKSNLEAAPVLVNFGEHKGGEGDDGTVSFTAPQGLTVSGDKLEIHAKATKYAQEHNVDFVTAVKKVS